MRGNPVNLVRSIGQEKVLVRKKERRRGAIKGSGGPRKATQGRVGVVGKRKREVGSELGLW